MAVSSDTKTLQDIQRIIGELRPSIQQDGGDIHFIKYEDDIVYVQLSGACVGCPASIITLKFGVEQALKEQLPQIKSVEMLDDE